MAPVDDLAGRPLGVFSPEGGVSEDALEDDGAHCPPVSGLVVAAAKQHLGCHVVARAAHREGHPAGPVAGLGGRGGLGMPQVGAALGLGVGRCNEGIAVIDLGGQPEVGQLEVAVLVDENVVRLRGPVAGRQ